ncbi:von willebrand factor type A [Methyloglobulus morosus KoM1]|uniref:von willebrand factor type A n=1 Tax=Methyloglobulus morosus KoM1 TaxID=1116472 RepID=V5DY88_9GAMM|nr:VWA domain-containing protein [Methyloglobulus morosus]ESS72291.1 von willebrand factor type A [Methyloglobulus morosus KoM1]
MTLSEFHFIRPYWLLALLPYAVLLVSLVRGKLSHGNWTAVCDAALLPYLLQDKAVSQNRWPLATGAVAAFLAIVALAGPTWERLPTPVFRNDSALVIVLDLSRSMDAADIKPSRLVMARYKIADILKQRKDGQTALVVYADEAFTVTPLTNDTETITNQLSALTTGIMPRDGNSTARALEKAETLFKQAGLQKGQILLITDGGSVDDAIAKAKSLDAYQLLVLGVGTSDGAPIALNTGGFLKDDQGSIVVDKLDVHSLEKLAQAGNGTYQSLTSDDADIQALLSTMTSQSHEKGEKNENLLLDQWRDVGPWLLLVVLPLAALNFRKGLLGIALLFLLPLPKNSYALDMDKAWQDLWLTKDQQAQEAYQQGDFNKAAELFQNPDWKAAAHYKSGAYDKALAYLKDNPSANSLYNQGNALAQSGQLKEALDAYNKALKLNPDDDDTQYNKKLVEKALEQQKQEPKQDQDKKQDSQDKKNQGESKNGDKSGQSQQDKSEENKDDQKPEQKSEQSQKSTEQQPEKEKAEEQQKDNPMEVAQPEPADPKKDDKKPSTHAQPLDTMSNEEKQANEQWLKRIPDDPAGLLRRKFKYQYNQRGRQ